MARRLVSPARRRRPRRLRMLAADVVREAIAQPLSRPWRSLLTVMGTVLGVGMLLTTVGITASARARINQHFDALLATEVDAQDAATGGIAPGFDAAGLDRVKRLSGVVAAGIIRQLPRNFTVARLPTAASANAAVGSGASPQVLVASAGALEVIRPNVVGGRQYGSLQEAHRARVALLGAAAAHEMGVSAADLPTTIYVGGNAFLAVGVITHVQRHSEFLLSVVIPETAEEELFGRYVSAPPEIIVATKLGYADAVGGVLPATVSPVQPQHVAVTTPPDAGQLRTQVAGDISGLFVILAVIGMVVGVIGIANTTLVSVLERVSEIGLRRAIGARRGQIAMQFLLESLILGVIGGVLGGTLGVVGVAGVAIANSWAPVVPVWICIAAPVLGGVAGVLAGVYPAARATLIEPVVALAR